ncbi:MAG: hypothetical protein EYC62_04325 [Alphaproteobacteria bacterium]|nr:MAG: hypothetical protein EYC62_04325 [Alphaproteobacteria bacterium]
MSATAEQKTAHKFIFETSFDDPASAAQDDKPNEALEALKKQAFAAGQQAALQSIERQTGEICAHVLKHMQHITSQYASTQEALMYKSLSVVLYSLQKLIPDLLSMQAEEQIESTVKQCLRFALDMPKLTIKVSDQIYGSVQPRLQSIFAESGFQGKASITADPTLKMGDCRVEWGNGGMETLPSHIWQHIHNMLYECLPKNVAESIPTDLQDPLPPEPEPEPVIEAAAEPMEQPPEQTETSEQNIEAAPESTEQPAENESSPEQPVTEQTSIDDGSK